MGVKKIAKGIARAKYKAETLPIQVAKKISSKVAPGSKVDQVLKKAATPFGAGGPVKKKRKSSGAANAGFGVEIK